MDFENKNISIPFHWGGDVLGITIVTLAILIGTGFYLTTKEWPATTLWLKYLLIIVLLSTVVIGLGYMPIRLKVNDDKDK